MEATVAVAIPAWRSNLATIAALMARAKNELLRVPGRRSPACWRRPSSSSASTASSAR